MSNPIDWNEPGGSGMAIGAPVVGGTPGSVLFVDSVGNLGENNAALFWDEGNGFLGVGTNAPSSALDVVGTVTISSDITFASGSGATHTIAPSVTVGDGVAGDSLFMSATAGSAGVVAAGGAGGSTTLRAGAGGAGTVATAAGVGGDFFIYAGSAGVDNGGGGGNGGNVTITAGVASGVSTAGSIILSSSGGLSTFRVNNSGSFVRIGTGAANTAPDILDLTHFTAGVAAVGLGIGMSATLENDAGTEVKAGRLVTRWSDPTAGAENADFRVFLISGGAISLTPSFTVEGATGMTTAQGGLAVFDNALAVSVAGSWRVRSTAGIMEVSQNGGAYAPIVTGTSTLQAAYDGGAAGQQLIQLSALNRGITIAGPAVVPAISSGDFAILLSTPTGAVTEGGANIVFSAGDAATEGAGGNFSLLSGDGAGTGAGGSIITTTGAGGLDGGDGGNWTITSGTGGAAVTNPGGAGGTIGITLGSGGAATAGQAAGSAGAFYVQGGQGGAGDATGAAGNGGGISLSAGGGGDAAIGLANTGGSGGQLNFYSGSPGGAVNGFGGAGGDINITAQQGGNCSGSPSFGGNGGAFNLGTGAGGSATTGGNAGAVAITTGNGGQSGGVNNGGTGGAFRVTAGDGGAAISTGTSGAGGLIALLSGNGVASGAGGTGGAGGAITIAAGDGGLGVGGGAGGAGGSLIIQGGQGRNTGAAGLNGGNGGSITLSGRNGGSGSAGATAGSGGGFTLTAGNAGASGGGTGAAGGGFALTLGNGSGSAANGAFTVTLGASAGATTGTATFQANDAATATTVDLLTLAHTTSGTAAASFGTGMLWNLESAGGTTRSAARNSVVWSVATNAAETAVFKSFLMTAGTLSTTVPVVQWSGVAGATVTVDDAATATTTDMLTLTHTTSGTAAASFGVGTLTNMESAAGTTRSAAREAVVWTVATNAAETARWDMYLMTGGALSTTVPAMSVSGVSGQTTTVNDAATATTTDLFTLTHTTSGTANTSFGVGMVYNLENANGTTILAARESLVWTDATNASEDSEYRLFLITAGAMPTTAQVAVNGTSGQTVLITDAGTTSSPNLLTVDHRSSGTAGIGYGVGILLRGQDATPTAGGDDMARMFTTWTNASAGTENSRFEIQLRGSGGALTSYFTLAATTGSVTLGAGPTITSASGAVTYGAASSTIVTCTNGQVSIGANTAATLTLNTSTSGAATNSISFAPSAYAAVTASTESAEFKFIGASRTWATTAPTTQRDTLWTPGTFAISGAGTITNAVGFAISAAPIAGTNATFTSTMALQVGGATAIGATSAGMTYAAIDVPEHTMTVTGSTQITSTQGFTGVAIGVVTITDASAVTLDNAASLYIAGAPLGAGSVTLTNPWAINSQNGKVNFQITDAATATVTNVLTLDHRSSGTPAANFGTGILFRGADASSTAGGDDLAAVHANWSTATSGSEASQLLFQLRASGASLATKMTLNTFGNLILTGTSYIGNGSTITVDSGFTSTTGGVVSLRPAGALGLNIRGAASAASSNIGFEYTMPLSTAQTTTVESSQVKVTGVVKTWANGAITTNRETVWTPGTMAFASGTNIVTNAIAFAITNALIAGTSAQFTNSVVFQAGGDVAIGATSAAMTYSAMNVPAHTVTVTGSTTITASGSFAAARLGIITITDASAVTINEASTLFIAGAPVAAGSVTLADNTRYGIDSRAEINKFGVEGATGARLRLAYFYGASPTDPPQNMTDIMIVDTGAAQVLRIRYNDAGTMRVGDVALV